MDALKFALGSGLYSGLTLKAPGTAGSFLALIFILLIVQAQLFGLLIVFLLVCSVSSLWVAPYFEEEFGKDPGVMVIDEWAGQCMTFLAITFTESLQTNILILLTGFLLFRFFDILKPLGIKKLQNNPGGIGILADDLLAGLYALICLKTLIFVWPNFLEIL